MTSPCSAQCNLHTHPPAGLLVTFVFLALNAAYKSFCTEGLSRLHSLTLVAQFITLYGGLVLIVEDYLSSPYHSVSGPIRATTLAARPTSPTPLFISAMVPS